jgi:GntR family transcriptional regulator
LISFTVDGQSGVPPYMQLVQQVRQALRLGRLRVGDQLPTVKEVVGAIAINPNTVLKAYRELEHDGLVEGRPGLGTFVLRVPSGPPPNVHAGLARRLSAWVRSARAAGLDDEAIQGLMHGVLGADDEAGVA